MKLEHGIPTKWHWIVWYPENCRIHPNTDIGSHTDIFGQCGVVIEEGVQIGAGCRIYSKNTIDGTEGPVKIMKDAKIGANSVILPGVTIYPGVKIGALSLVKEDVYPNQVVCGITVKEVRKCTGSIYQAY